MTTSIRLVDRVTDLDDLTSLDEYAAAIAQETRARLDQGTTPLDICAAIADSHEHLTRRLIELALEATGAPPCPYAWLLLGSHGRREPVPSSDQDNAIVYDAHDDEEAAETYFSHIANLVVPALIRAGLPECDGGFMATRWCRPVAAYTTMFRSWIDDPEPQELVSADVFCDVVAFHGTLTVQRWDDVLLTGGGRGPFRAQMARAAVIFKPPLNTFGRVRAGHEGVDVKTGGTAPIVLLARLYAFMAGSRARSTTDRLRDAVDAGALHPETARDILDAYSYLMYLRLREQSNRIGLDTLTPVERTRLRTSLKTVRDLQTVTAQTFATHTLT